MPPKNAKKVEKEERKVTENDGERSTERELQLEKELEMMSKEAENLKKRMVTLKAEHEWLEDEAQQFTMESQEYMNYMAKKANLRQTAIITLNDQNRKELDEIKMKKEALIKEFEAKKTDCNQIINEKKQILDKLNNEFDGYLEFKILRDEQAAEIKTIEDEMDRLRIEHSKSINLLKTQFLKEKSELKRESDNKIQIVIKAANREAKECLIENTHKIKHKNQKLRTELFSLIQYTKELRANKAKLEKQKEKILQEISYAEDLRKLRTNQQIQVQSKLNANMEEP